jgi:hypothetical protein
VRRVLAAVLVALGAHSAAPAAHARVRAEVVEHNVREAPGVAVAVSVATGETASGATTTTSAETPTAETTGAGPPPITAQASPSRASARPYGPQPCLRRKYGGSVGALRSLCAPSRGRPATPRGQSGRRASPETVGRILADRARALAPAPRIEVAPARVGLAGLEAFFWVDPPRPITASAGVAGVFVTAEARVVQHGWSFGDGADAVTSTPGRPWTRERPGSLGHTYESSGRYDVVVEQIWEARWRPRGGPWHRLGYFSTVGTRTYPVRAVVALLAPRR